MDVFQAIRERRSVRKFKPDPISENMVKDVLEAGIWAPSWANTQCWRFVVVRDEGIRARLAETMEKGNPAAEAVRKAPVTLIICGELRKSGYYKGEASTEKGDWYMFDTALACQNMMLAAYAIGLGSVAIGLFDAATVARILQTPADIKVVLMMPLGYPDEQPKTPRRRELAEITYYEGYGQPFHGK